MKADPKDALRGAPSPGDKSAREAESIWKAMPFIIAYWVAGLAVIFSNAGILRKVPCPACLTAWHMACSSILVHLLHVLRPQLFITGDAKLGRAVILKRILPIAVMFALTLGIGNRAYVTLSVAFIQMVKASHPVLAYMISCILGIEALKGSKLQATFVVTVGVMLSVTGELHFDPVGFAFQAFGSLTECSRVVLIGALLSSQGLRLDPLTALSYYAPLAFVFLVPLAFALEVPTSANFGAFWQQIETEIGFLWLLANGVMAFCLNLAVVGLIARTDPVIYVVVGVLKDVFTVVISAFFLGTPVTPQQVFGYILALIGVQVFNLVQKNPEDFDSGLFRGMLQRLRRRTVQAPLKASPPLAPSSEAAAAPKAREAGSSAPVQRRPRTASPAPKQAADHS